MLTVNCIMCFVATYDCGPERSRGPRETCLPGLNLAAPFPPSSSPLAAAAAAAMSGFFRRIAGDAFSRTFLIAKAFCVIHVINEHVCSLSLVRGPSMLPAMNLAGDVVAVDKVSVRRGKVGPGDVVLLISPEDPRKLVAKRVHGLEGETVTYFVDPGNSSASKTVVVPKGHVWVQGDNPYASRDSRQFGPVPYGLITGKIFCRVWPPKRFGSIDSDAQELC